MEGCGFRDEAAEFTKRGVEVYGVSVDTVDSHQKFASKFNFNFPLLADTDEKICAAYGVNVKEKQYPERVTFVVNKQGKITKVFHKVSPKTHVKEVLEALDSL